MEKKATELLSQFPNDIVLRASPVRWICVGLILLVGALIGVWGLFLDKNVMKVVGFLLCAVLFPGVYFCFSVAFSDKNRLTISVSGIQFCLFKCYEPIKWTNVRNFRVGLIGYALRIQYDKWVGDDAESNRRSGKWVTLYLPDAYNIKMEELIKLLEEYRRMALFRSIHPNNSTE